jgi:hypothetical protein
MEKLRWGMVGRTYIHVDARVLWDAPGLVISSGRLWLAPEPFSTWPKENA